MRTPFLLACLLIAACHRARSPVDIEKRRQASASGNSTTTGSTWVLTPVTPAESKSCSIPSSLANGPWAPLVRASRRLAGSHGVKPWLSSWVASSSWPNVVSPIRPPGATSDTGYSLKFFE